MTQIDFLRSLNYGALGNRLYRHGLATALATVQWTFHILGWNFTVIGPANLYLTLIRVGWAIDHGRSDELGHEANWKKNSTFWKLVNFCSVFQNDLAFLGRIGKASLFEFPEIYGWVYQSLFAMLFRPAWDWYIQTNCLQLQVLPFD